jgi:hypothetical protein
MQGAGVVFPRFTSRRCDYRHKLLRFIGLSLELRLTILLDECLPARLRPDLPGHDVQTVPRTGWAGTKSGKLLRLIAAAATFDVLVTMDKNLPERIAPSARKSDAESA